MIVSAFCFLFILQSCLFQKQEIKSFSFLSRKWPYYGLFSLPFTFMFMAISFLVFEGKESLLSQFSLAYPIHHVFKKIVFKATLPIHNFQVQEMIYILSLIYPKHFIISFHMIMQHNYLQQPLLHHSIKRKPIKGNNARTIMQINNNRNRTCACNHRIQILTTPTILRKY